MSRPSKSRRICEMPNYTGFGPKGGRGNGNRQRGRKGTYIELTLDEFEVLRLIDYESLNQEACAKQMAIARSTVQRIYNSARAKLGQMIVEGKELKIQGGNYALCDHDVNGCGRCHHNNRA